MGSMSIMHWAIVLLIILLVFGTKKLTGAGGDLGRAIKNFKDEVNGGENKESHNNARVIDVTPTENKETK